jgi:hypothetical protein
VQKASDTETGVSKGIGPEQEAACTPVSGDSETKTCSLSLGQEPDATKLIPSASLRTCYGNELAMHPAGIPAHESCSAEKEAEPSLPQTATQQLLKGVLALPAVAEASVEAPRRPLLATAASVPGTGAQKREQGKTSNDSAAAADVAPCPIVTEGLQEKQDSVSDRKDGSSKKRQGADQTHVDSTPFLVEDGFAVPLSSNQTLHRCALCKCAPDAALSRSLLASQLCRILQSFTQLCLHLLVLEKV